MAKHNEVAMKYNKSELHAKAAEAASVEIYEYIGKSHAIHTDNVKYVCNGSFDMSEIDDIKFDENGEVDADVQLMGREEMEATILANCGESWDDMYDENDKVLVIILK